MKSVLCAYYISWRRRWVYSDINYSTMNAIQWLRRTSWTFAKSCLAIRDIVILITNWKIIHNCPLQDKYTVIISQWRIFSLVELRTGQTTVLYCTAQTTDCTVLCNLCWFEMSKPILHLLQYWISAVAVCDLQGLVVLRCEGCSGGAGDSLSQPDPDLPVHCTAVLISS